MLYLSRPTVSDCQGAETYNKAFSESAAIVGITAREPVHFALAEPCAL